MSKWKCANYDGNDLIHAGPPCDCVSGCGGDLCLTCCEEEMFGINNE